MRTCIMALNGIVRSYQLDQSLSMLRGVGFYFFFDRNFCQQTVETLIRHHDQTPRSAAASDQWVSTVCSRPTKRTIGLYGLINII